MPFCGRFTRVLQIVPSAQRFFFPLPDENPCNLGGKVTVPVADLDGIERGSYRLVYRDKPTDSEKSLLQVFGKSMRPALVMSP
jgi:hypothetical protein